MEYDYQLVGGKLKVKFVESDGWNIKAIRSDNGELDTFPINYFRNNFKTIKQ